MIDSYIHHHGGPIFFALSLIPFAGVTWVLMRWEARATKTTDSKSTTNGEPAAASPALPS